MKQKALQIQCLFADRDGDLQQLVCASFLLYIRRFLADKDRFCP